MTETKSEYHSIKVLEMIAEIENKFVCHNCIGDEILSTEVSETGEYTQCSYCCEVRNAWTIAKLSPRIAEVLESQFRLTTHDYVPIFRADDKVDYESEGDSIDWTICEIAEIDYEVACDVIEFLSDFYAYEVIKYGETDYYDSGAHYQELSPNDLGFRYSWLEFQKDVGERARFFNGVAEEILDDIFGDLAAHRTIYDESVIREIGPEHSDRFIWRARTAESSEVLKTILTAPIRELGPPPSNLPVSGRMHAAGISVFYGAFDAKTCIAEIRPSVGSHVVLGKFELLRNMRLLDLNLLANVYGGGSHFDPDYATNRGRAAFLEYLVHEICRPVMPKKETLEYIPTQVVAEYLASRVKPRLDGIIYPSSQVDGEGNNLVLFNHASRVEPESGISESNISRIDLPGLGEDNTVAIWTQPKDVSSDKQSLSEASNEWIRIAPAGISLTISESDDTWSRSEAALRLDPDSIKVKSIQAVSYTSKELAVMRLVERNNPSVAQF